jgi:hypothetical protein
MCRDLSNLDDFCDYGFSDRLVKEPTPPSPCRKLRHHRWRSDSAVIAHKMHLVMTPLLRPCMCVQVLPLWLIGLGGSDFPMFAWAGSSGASRTTFVALNFG